MCALRKEVNLKPFITSMVLCPMLALGLSLAHAQAPAKPNDAQIAQIVNAADTIDIKAGQLALSKSNNAQVKAFAQDMVRDHTQVNEQALALVKKLNVQPQNSDTSRALTKQADDEMKRLQGLNGAAFDKAYAANELAYHRQVNDAVRNTLIPSASNPELKSLLQQGLKIFEGHQQHAEQLVKELR
jgi:putative membrane protein